MNEQITLGGGCFWCLDAVYRELQGVLVVESGYMGGETINPTYEQVCSGRTGHAEVVRVTFDTGKITLKEIMEVFFVIHDPTTLNRQGNDVGTQYRSVIFYNGDDQKTLAEQTIESLNQQGLFSSPIVTEIAPLSKFYIAEEYHQNYYQNNQNQPYCTFVISPKVAKFRKEFMNKLR